MNKSLDPKGATEESFIGKFSLLQKFKFLAFCAGIFHAVATVLMLIALGVVMIIFSAKYGILEIPIFAFLFLICLVLGIGLIFYSRRIRTSYGDYRISKDNFRYLTVFSVGLFLYLGPLLMVVWRPSLSDDSTGISMMNLLQDMTIFPVWAFVICPWLASVQARKGNYFRWSVARVILMLMTCIIISIATENIYLEVLDSVAIENLHVGMPDSMGYGIEIITVQTPLYYIINAIAVILIVIIFTLLSKFTDKYFSIVSLALILTLGTMFTVSGILQVAIYNKYHIYNFSTYPKVKGKGELPSFIAGYCDANGLTSSPIPLSSSDDVVTTPEIGEDSVFDRCPDDLQSPENQKTILNNSSDLMFFDGKTGENRRIAADEASKMKLNFEKTSKEGFSVGNVKRFYIDEVCGLFKENDRSGAIEIRYNICNDGKDNTYRFYAWVE